MVRRRAPLKPVSARPNSFFNPPPLPLSLSFLATTTLLAILSSHPSPLTPPSSHSSPSSSQPFAPVLSGRVIRSFPHDPTAFTQGLAFHDGTLYESTGLQGRSSIRRVDLETGAVEQRQDLERTEFGEGLCMLGNGDDMLQVLWKVGKGYVWRRNGLEKIKQIAFKGDAWGITNVEGKQNEIWMSNGTAVLGKWKLENKQLRKIDEMVVTDGNKQVGLLNELEMVNGELWANVWGCEFVVRIDINTGKVIGWIDLRGLLKQEEMQHVDVLNGIAYDQTTGRVFVTGKLWPRLFQVQVTDNMVANKISDVIDAFFLSKHQVNYILTRVLA